MARGPLGLPRPLGVLPLTEGGLLFRQPETAEEMSTEVEDIIQNMELDPDIQDDSNEYDRVVDELALRVFPDSDRKRTRFRECISSNWGESWSENLLDSSQENSTDLEQASMAAAGCKGMVESNTIEIEQ
jgi:hypothetical protein